MLVKRYIVNESDLIERCKKEDPLAQKFLFETYKQVLFGVIMRYVKDFHLAEDVLADTFIQVFEKISQFKGNGSFEGWVKRVAVTQSLMTLRANKKIFYTDDDSTVEKVAMPSIYNQLEVEELMLCIQDLPDGYRMVFNLYVIEGYKHREIADMLSISIHTSKSQLIMARKRLADIISSRYSNQSSINEIA